MKNKNRYNFTDTTSIPNRKRQRDRSDGNSGLNKTRLVLTVENSIKCNINWLDFTTMAGLYFSKQVALPISLIQFHFTYEVSRFKFRWSPLGWISSMQENRHRSSEDTGKGWLKKTTNDPVIIYHLLKLFPFNHLYSQRPPVRSVLHSSLLSPFSLLSLSTQFCHLFFGFSGLLKIQQSGHDRVLIQAASFVNWNLEAQRVVKNRPHLINWILPNFWIFEIIMCTGLHFIFVRILGET